MGKQRTKKQDKEKPKRGPRSSVLFHGKRIQGGFLLPSPMNHTRREKERLREREREGRSAGDGNGANGTARCARPSHDRGPSRHRERSSETEGLN